MDRYRAYLLPGVAALIVLAYFGWRWTTNSGAVEPTSTPAAPKGAEPKAVGEPSRSSGAAEPAKPAPEPSVALPAPAPTPSAGPAGAAPRPRDRARRDALREQIAAAQRARTRRGADEPSEPEAVGELPKEYLRARVREDLIPLAQECYDNALADDETLAGKLVFQFRIVGEPDVGGVVEDAQLAPESDIQHAELVECMRESLMSMSFDPPENGGVMDVTYPFEFATEAPSDAPAGAPGETPGGAPEE